MFSKVIKINGMHCAGCSRRVETALNAIDGAKATVDLKAGTATVTADREIPDATLINAVEELGFDAAL